VILTFLESPYAEDVRRNLAYVRACLRDSLGRGEAPLASHALWIQPGVLDDAITEQRRIGMEAGFAWATHAQRLVFYLDFGWSNGMTIGLTRAKKSQAHIRTRTLGLPWSAITASDAELSR